MRQNYTIELAAEYHLRAIPAIEQAAAAMFAEVDLPSKLRFLVTDKETLIEAQRDERLWVALDEQKNAVGFALARDVGDYAHLEEMNVHPDHGRQGIGSQLLGAVINWARAAGFPGITLITFRHLQWNAPFYEKHGFIELEHEESSRGLRELICEEAEAGLEPRNRVAMLHSFNGTTGIKN
jgi:GNAT superfamily N-acetyltransferase